MDGKMCDPTLNCSGGAGQVTIFGEIFIANGDEGGLRSCSIDDRVKRMDEQTPARKFNLRSFLFTSPLIDPYARTRAYCIGHLFVSLANSQTDKRAERSSCIRRSVNVVFFFVFFSCSLDRVCRRQHRLAVNVLLSFDSRLAFVFFFFFSFLSCRQRPSALTSGREKAREEREKHK